MFVHKLLTKLQTKNGNRFEYVKNVIFTERIQPGSNNRGQKIYTVKMIYINGDNK